APVEQKAAPLLVQAIGTVEASSVVSVRAQVGGELLRVHIQEGQDVHKGDILFTIDPRPFEAALAQAQANLAPDVGQAPQGAPPPSATGRVSPRRGRRWRAIRPRPRTPGSRPIGMRSCSRGT